MACSKYDKILVVLQDGAYKVIEVPDKLFLGKELLYCATPEREREMTMAYRHKGVTYLKRFTLGARFSTRTTARVRRNQKSCSLNPHLLKCFTSHKAAPRQKVSQQTANPGELGIKSAKAKGNQVSIKELTSFAPSRPRIGMPKLPPPNYGSFELDDSGSPVDEAPTFSSSR